MGTCMPSPRSTRSPLRILGLTLAVVLVLAMLLGFAFTARAQAAVSYSDQELAFINLLNNYRSTNGLQPLLLSDMITEACDRHNSDMAKYSFFNHYSLASDWFAYNASPWDRMAMSGYAFNTSMAENIAAGQTTAAQVFDAWKNSAGHNTNMLGAAYKVIGVSLVIVPGSPYTCYWTTDFGGYVDATAHTPGQPSPAVPRYQQTSSLLASVGPWATYSSTRASGGSYGRSSSNTASVTVTFNGTYLAWIATKGTTLGKAFVSLDGNTPVSVNLAASVAAYQQRVWDTGTLSPGAHTVKIWRDPDERGRQVHKRRRLRRGGEPDPSAQTPGSQPLSADQHLPSLRGHLVCVHEQCGLRGELRSGQRRRSFGDRYV